VPGNLVVDENLKHGIAKLIAPTFLSFHNLVDSILWCQDLSRLLHITIMMWSFAEEQHGITV